MTDFLSASACCGHKPRQLKLPTLFPRAELLSKMVRQRNLIRFIVAPPFYGKTSLVFQYADSIFSFENVFWINGKSPCFLRDLDRKILASSLLQKTDTLSLVIIEDIPLLDQTRKTTFIKDLKSLIDQEREVIVTMTPTCDVFEGDVHEVMRLQSMDLLLNDEEFAGCNELLFCEASSNEEKLWQRIPGMTSRTADQKLAYNAISIQDYDPVDLKLAQFIMLVLRTGRKEDVVSLMGSCDEGVCGVLETYYVHLGINLYHESFDTIYLPLDVCVHKFKAHLKIMASRAPFPNISAFISRLADVLMVKGDGERACMLVQLYCVMSERQTWLNLRSRQLMDMGCILPAHRLYQSISSSSPKQGGLLAAEEAWRLFMLGESDTALKMATKIVKRSNTEESAIGWAALLVLWQGRTSEAKNAQSLLEGIAKFSLKQVKKWCDENRLASELSQGQPWHLPVLGFLCLHRSIKDGYVFLVACKEAGINDPYIALVLIALLEQREALNTYQDNCARAKALTEELDRSIEEYLLMRYEQFSLSFLDVYLCQRVEGILPGYLGSKKLPKGLISNVQSIWISFLEQRAAFRKLYSELGKTRSVSSAQNRSCTHITLQGAKNKIDIPPLRIKLFGSFEVRIGDQIVNPLLLRRQKVKILLAILAANQGKDLACDRLCEILWPESPLEAARNNFYGVWSMLKKALSIVDGYCPYLNRQQFSCRLNNQLVESDIMEFELFCRKLQFGIVQQEEWAQLYNQIMDLYTGDILPGEMKSSHIKQMRKEYHNRLIDTFTAAATRLYEMGEYQASLWYARTIVDQDNTREDAYAILMKIQISLGQRTAAIETYFNCRRYLADELGIDPSAKTNLLYNKIIMEESRIKEVGIND